MIDKQLLDEAKRAIISCDKDKALDIARRAVDEGIDPMELMNHGFIPGINEVGDLFERGELFLPELVLAGEIMKAASTILSEALTGQEGQNINKIVIATVEGDVHDIGKGIVVSLFKAYGFTVYDLGRDVKTETIIKKAVEVGADIIGTSALLTTTIVGQRKLEEELRKAGLRDRFKTMVGGAPVTQRWADKIGADAYAEDAYDGVKKAQKLLGL